MIPLVDLAAQHAPIRVELDAAIRHVVDQGTFALGPAVQEFEEAFARYLGVRHCVGVQSGTAALQIALLRSTCRTPIATSATGPARFRSPRLPRVRCCRCRSIPSSCRRSRTRS